MAPTNVIIPNKIHSVIIPNKFWKPKTSMVVPKEYKRMSPLAAIINPLMRTKVAPVKEKMSGTIGFSANTVFNSRR